MNLINDHSEDGKCPTNQILRKSYKSKNGKIVDAVCIKSTRGIEK